IPMTVGLYFAGPGIFSAAKDPEIERMAFDYFRWRLPGIPFLIAMLAMIGFFNGISRPKIPLKVYIVVLILNGVFCWLLVGGKFGFPAMGIAGAGLAATLSVFVGFAAFIVILLTHKYRGNFGTLHFLRNFDKTVLKSLLFL